MAKYPLAGLSRPQTASVVEDRLARELARKELAWDGEPAEFCRRLVELACERYPDRALPQIALHLTDNAVLRAENRITFLQQEPADRLSFDLDVWEYVAEEQGLDLEILGRNRAERFRWLRAELLGDVKGQDHAVEAICRRLEDHASRPSQPAPRGRFLFAGPPGVGKTELARSLARHLGLGDESFSRFNMSEYSGEAARTHFMGADPGYDKAPWLFWPGKLTDWGAH